MSGILCVDRVSLSVSLKRVRSCAGREGGGGGICAGYVDTEAP